MGSSKYNQEEKSNEFVTSILSTLEGSSESDDGGRSMKVKALRKLVFMSLQCDEDDKSTKKKFKKAVQSLESSAKVKLCEDGTVTLLVSTKKSKKKKDKKKKDKKKKKDEVEDDADADDAKEAEKKSKKKKREEKEEEEDGKEEEDMKKSKKRKTDDEDNDDYKDNDAADDYNQTKTVPENDPNKNKKCKGNPSGITRLFLGNLPFAVDEHSLESFLSPAVLTHIKWITDQITGKFYGSAFVEMRNSRDAALVLTSKNGQSLMNRAIKVNYAPSRPGDVWPPKTKVWTGGKQRSAGGEGVKAMSPKPDNCTKLFIGNLSYDIDDEAISKFFGNVDAEVKAVRWICHRDTGDFKGVGYVEFWNTEACEKAATLNGKNLLGRPIRIDWDAGVSK